MKIYDYGDQYAARFTLVTDDGSVYVFSGNPFDPQGFGLYTYEIEEIKDPNFGEEITLADLPTDMARKFCELRNS